MDYNILRYSSSVLRDNTLSVFIRQNVCRIRRFSDLNGEKRKTYNAATLPYPFKALLRNKEY
ncbi:MAG: hypothetical protein ACI9FN_002663 [Saprospiraceae bacterium]|jgi:hypothetical protein